MAQADLLKYWNLNERPFEATWDTRFFYPSHDHDRALSQLGGLAGGESALFGMLTGETGSGKTLTRAVFTERLVEDRFTVVTVENSKFGFCDLLAAVLKRLNGVPPRGKRTRHARAELLFGEAERIRSQGGHLVLIFDEAQEMPTPTLNELKMLTNFNGEGRGHLTIILVGQPELQTHVAEMPQVDQRVSLRFHLNSLDAENSGAYLKHRLKVAGHPTGDLFTGDAVQWAFQVSGGLPLKLNRIAKLALEHAWEKRLPNVPLASVNAVIPDLARPHVNARGPGMNQWV